jgi:hypothetical protein
MSRQLKQAGGLDIVQMIEHASLMSAQDLLSRLIPNMPAMAGKIN